MTRENNKQINQTLKLVRLGRKYNLKSVEVAGDFIKIEFNESSTPILTKKASKKERELVQEAKMQSLLEEMQLLDPEAYEEELLKQDGGLKEI